MMMPANTAQGAVGLACRRCMPAPTATRSAAMLSALATISAPMSSPYNDAPRATESHDQELAKPFAGRECSAIANLLDTGHQGEGEERHPQHPEAEPSTRLRVRRDARRVVIRSPCNEPGRESASRRATLPVQRRRCRRFARRRDQPATCGTETSTFRRNSPSRHRRRASRYSSSSSLDRRVRKVQRRVLQLSRPA